MKDNFTEDAIKIKWKLKSTKGILLKDNFTQWKENLNLNLTRELWWKKTLTKTQLKSSEN